MRRIWRWSWALSERRKKIQQRGLRRFDQWGRRKTACDISASRGDKKDVVNNCYLFLRDSSIFIDRKMNIHLALGMFLVTFFFPPCHAACEILVPQAGIEPGPWQWNSCILTIGPPANSLCDLDKCGFLSLLNRKAWLWCVQKWM